MKQIEVQIMGQAYVLGCPEDGEVHLRQAVARVDEAMGKIRDSGKVKARDRVAVLAALNIAFELEQAHESAQQAAAATAPASPAEAAPTVPETPAELPAAAPEQAAPPPAATDDWHQRLIAKLDEALRQDGQLL